MSCRRSFGWVTCWMMGLSCLGKTFAAAPEFFERRVRPILVEHCHGCHSAHAKELKGGLRLDSREGLLEGGEGGPVVVVGDPNASRLIQAVRRTGDLKMPPKNELTEADIAVLAEWVAAGVPWPRSNAVAGPDPSTRMEELRQKHWAFRALARPPVPTVKDSAWGLNPIDRFVLARLEEENMKPSDRAGKGVLIRRAYLDLIGIPPSPEEVDAFISDRALDAWPRLVDRLLERPEYGERWARHWLDVARYADTKGYVDGGEARYPFAYTYRDYVIRAFNSDLPYDTFILEQLAGDQLEDKREGQALAALGFLTVGHRFNLFPHEVLDDRIDVVSRGLMGLTVTCARCHDHKFDPIAMADYYAWYGVFASSREPTPDEWPVLEQRRASPEFSKKVEEAARALRSLREKLHGQIQHEMRSWANDYLVYIVQTLEEHRTQPQPPLRTERGLLREVTAYGRGGVERWREYIARCGEADAIFGLWNRLMAMSRDEAGRRGPALALELAGSDKMNPLLAEAVGKNPPGSLLAAAEMCGQLLEETEERWQKALKLEPGKKQFDDPAWEQFRLVLYGMDAPPMVSLDDSEDLYQLNEHVDARGRYAALERVFLDPKAPARAMIVIDRQDPYEPHLFLRGNPSRLGKAVPRRFLRLFSNLNDQPFQRGSGRLELARAIVDPRNPLTARVWVNRVWGWHFGEALARTPSDFGARSEPPSHPELLDYLAGWFMEQGWSTKALHRLILTSQTYQQQSVDRPGAREKDPDNRMLWRMNRRRLDFESMRDSMLAVCGQLDERMGGRPVNRGFDEPDNFRRTIYGLVDREHLPNLMRVFDFPSPDLSSPQRARTTVPQQTLFLLNNPFVLARAEALARRLSQAGLTTLEERVQRLHRWVYGRAARSDEVELARLFLSGSPPEDMDVKEPGPWTYGYGRLVKGQMESFEPLPYFTGEAWQGGAVWPDPHLEYLRLTATGGHAGIDPAHDAVRRWTAPMDGMIDITGVLKHGEESCGDGVQAWILSGRAGELGHWTAFNSAIETGVTGLVVRAGETIDFVVDAKNNHSCDLFAWAPVIRLVSPLVLGSAPPTQALEWKAERDFESSRPPKPAPLSPWAQYAQVLLESNEFEFVD